MGEVVTYQYKPPYKMYCQLRLDSGERILISIGDTGIKISRHWYKNINTRLRRANPYRHTLEMRQG
jgi:hypothetical protein